MRARRSKLADFGEKIGGARKDVWSGEVRLTDWEMLSDEDLSRVARKERIWPPWQFEGLLEFVRSEEICYRLSRFRRAIVPQAQLFHGVSFRDSCELYFETLQYVKAWATRLQRGDHWDVAVECLVDGYCLVPKAPLAPDALWPGTAEDSKLCEGPRAAEEDDYAELLSVVLGDKALQELMRRSAHHSQRDRAQPRTPEQISSALRREFGIDPCKKDFLLAVLTEAITPTPSLWQAEPRIYRQVEAARRAVRSLSKRERRVFASWLGYRKPVARVALRPGIPSPKRSGLPSRYHSRPDSEQIMADLGIRGGEFGNWVRGRERPVVLSRLYMALVDLAEVLGIDRSMIGLGGRLSVGFGSRGRGGRNAALAHFEPWTWSIALTRYKSNGTLCHEWAHGLDLWLGAVSLPPDIPAGRVRNAMLSGRVFQKVRELFSCRPWPEDIYDPAHWTCFKLPFEVVRPLVAIAESLYARAITPVESAQIRDGFEAQFHKQMEEIANLVTDVLANPYPIGQIRPYEPLNQKQAREILKCVSEISAASPDSIRAVAHLATMVKNVSGHIPCSRFIDTLMAWIELIELVRNVAASIHDGTGSMRVMHPWAKYLHTLGTYWERPEEIFARSVEAYVFKCLADKGGSNEFLVSDFCMMATYPDFSSQPELEAAMCDFFTAIKATGLLDPKSRKHF